MNSIRRTLALAMVLAVTGALILAVPSKDGADSARAVSGSSMGTKAVAHYAGGKVIRGKSINATGKALYVGEEASEPTIGTTKNGDLYYVALGSNLGPSVRGQRTARSGRTSHRRPALRTATRSRSTRTSSSTSGRSASTRSTSPSPVRTSRSATTRARAG